MIWIGLLLSLASCKDSLEAITLGGDELPTEGVTLSIQLPNFTPQEISTRAGGETTESITSLWLVCYGTSGNYLGKQNCTEAYADATADADGYKKIKTNLPKGTETVHLSSRILKMLIIRLPSNTRSIMLVYLEKLKIWETNSWVKQKQVGTTTE